MSDDVLTISVTSFHPNERRAAQHSPSDPSDMSQMPMQDPAQPWFPVAQPRPPGSYGIVMLNGEPSAATWNGKGWWNGYGEVKAATAGGDSQHMKEGRNRLNLSPFRSLFPPSL